MLWIYCVSPWFGAATAWPFFHVLFSSYFVKRRQRVLRIKIRPCIWIFVEWRFVKTCENVPHRQNNLSLRVAHIHYDLCPILHGCKGKVWTEKQEAGSQPKQVLKGFGSGKFQYTLTWLRRVKYLLYFSQSCGVCTCKSHDSCSLIRQRYG